MRREALDETNPEETGPMEQPLAMAFRIRDVVDRTLTLFRKGSLSLKPTNAQAVIEAALEPIRSQAERAGVSLEVHCDHPPPELIADATLLSEALGCLMTNAVQAMPDGGTLRIDASRNEQSSLTRFRVADTGPGISDDLRERVFEPYFTARRSGTGLGLPIARGIARGHGGQLRIDPHYVGGTCMVLEIPQNWSTSRSTPGPGVADEPAERAVHHRPLHPGDD